MSETAKQEMNEDTMHLLEECESGCKMAIESMEQVVAYADDDKQKQIIHSYKEKHENLAREAAEALKAAGKPEKEPGAMASAFSWLTTEWKMKMNDNGHQVAKLMMDGCNMGIQSICEYQNRYHNASRQAVDAAKSLVKMEEDFMQEMKQFL